MTIYIYSFFVSPEIIHPVSKTTNKSGKEKHFFYNKSCYI
jgi:hypothetical protein